MSRSIALSILVICLIAVLVDQSSGKTPRKRTAEQTESKRKPEEAYRRYVNRKPSPHKDDLYMEEIFEVFNTKSRPPSYFASDEEIDLFIKCDYQPNLEECKRLKEPTIPEDVLEKKPPLPPVEHPQMSPGNPEMIFGEGEDFDVMPSPPRRQHPGRPPLNPYVPFDQYEEYDWMPSPPRRQYPSRLNPYFGMDQEEEFDLMPSTPRRQYPRRPPTNPTFEFDQDEDYDMMPSMPRRQYPGMGTRTPNFGYGEYDTPTMRGPFGGVMPEEPTDEGDYNYDDDEAEYDSGRHDQFDEDLL